MGMKTQSDICDRLKEEEHEAVDEDERDPSNTASGP